MTPKLERVVASYRQTGRNRINGIINKCVFICTAARCRLFLSLSLFYPQSTTHCQLIESDCGSGIVPKYTSRHEVEGEDDDALSNRTRAATQCTIVALRMCIMCASQSTRDYNKMTIIIIIDPLRCWGCQTKRRRRRFVKSIAVVVSLQLICYCD